MIRHLSVATALALTLALPAIAEESKNKIDPGTGPTSTMTDQVPQMKRDAEAMDNAGPNSATPLPSTKAVGEAVPSMRPNDAVSGQTDNKSSTGAAAATAPGTVLTLTEQQGKSWIDKPVYSSDGKKIGEVAAFKRDAASNIIGLLADIGGYFGLGETRISVVPAQFKLQGDRVILGLTADEAKKLPAVQS